MRNLAFTMCTLALSACYNEEIIFNIETPWCENKSITSESTNISGVYYKIQSPEYIMKPKVYVDNFYFDEQLEGGSKTRERILISNQKPEISDITPSSLYIGSNLEYQVKATDKDGDRLVYAIVTGPNWMKIDKESGILSGTPKESNLGINYFTIAVDDGLNRAFFDSFLLVEQEKNIIVNNKELSF
ncbi:Rhs Family [Vibrio sp. B1FIG11]|uniref:Ig domain-containing protein n=1 Tax=Vibrio sp. B1FIG11 TaxID=2751177 RepID=UPI001AF5810F|nr:Ig domain-containing protein [Vibrio sp. B1FIG11]CAD7826911.1 Rhs Family [Vibrio sp. B1FIG11]CAE6962095.1 Rhs Family [Vibrio sp. B1FIG11]